MQAIPLGRVTVATAGTPVTLASLLTAAQVAMIPPSGQIMAIEVWPDPSVTGIFYVLCQGVKVAAVPKATSTALPWSTPDTERNAIAYSQFSFDVASNGDGAYITLWVE